MILGDPVTNIHGIRKFGLNVIATEVEECTACELYKTPGKCVLYRGSPYAKLVCLGEAPGATEAELGLPFVGKAGKLLDNIIKSMGLDPEEVFVANIIKHRPPDNRKPTTEEMNACLPFLKKQLDIVQPKCIVAFGNTAAIGLLGDGPGISKRRGQWFEWNGIPVICTYHPAACLYNPKLKEDVWNDVQKCMSRFEEFGIKNNLGKGCAESET